jgi:hypothetical protein
MPLGANPARATIPRMQGYLDSTAAPHVHPLWHSLMAWLPANSCYGMAAYSKWRQGVTKAPINGTVKLRDDQLKRDDDEGDHSETPRGFKHEDHDQCGLCEAAHRHIQIQRNLV